MAHRPRSTAATLRPLPGPGRLRVLCPECHGPVLLHDWFCHECPRALTQREEVLADWDEFFARAA